MFVIRSHDHRDVEPACRSLLRKAGARPESVAAACVEFLRKPFEGHWRARRGEYRVRYAIDDAQSEVVVLDISHRWDAYR